MTCIVEVVQGTSSFRFEVGDDVFVDCTVTLNEGKKASTASVILADPVLDLFDTMPLPTKQSRINIDVWMADGNVEIPAKVFSGFVQGLQPSIGSGANTLVIDAADKMKGGRRRKRATILRFSTAEQYVTRAATDNDLTVDLTRANLTDVEFSRIVQHGETDWAVLVRVMASVGHKAKVRGSTLYIEELGATRDGAEAASIVLTYGDNLVSLSPKINERSASRALNVFDFDGEQVQTDDDAEAEDRPVTIQRAGLALATADFPSFSTQQILKAKQAQARAKRVFEGTATAAGLYVSADTDDVLVLERVGKRLSGVWNIDQLRLSYADRTTSFGIFNGGAE